MASLESQVDTIRNAVASVSTCTPIISATLKELLQNRDGDSNTASQVTKSRTTKASTTTNTTATTAARRQPSTANRRGAKSTTNSGEKNAHDDKPRLGAKEKALLATQVINATLKALSDAAKTPPNGLVKAATRKALRRSSSMPMTPLNPRSLNRVSTSPMTARTCRSPSLPASSACLATVESLQSSGTVQLPELQLESGIMFEQAVKELRILKRCLESKALGSIAKKAAPSTTDPNAPARTLSDLLDYSQISATGPLLGYIINAQLQALRILHGLKKTTHLDAILQHLQPSNTSSPLNLLLRSLEDDKADRVKCSRQLESLSQSLLSLPPSIAAKDDGVALESRLSPSIESALEVQALGLAIRLESWAVSGHKGDVDKDILSPLGKCLTAFSRRNSSSDLDSMVSAFSQVWGRIEKLRLKPSVSSKAPLAMIYQLLVTRWISRLSALLDSKTESAVKCCAVTAQLLAITIMDSKQADQKLAQEILDGLQGSLSGSTTELDELLVNICLLRKAVVQLLGQRTHNNTPDQPTREVLETLVFQLPRFALRWLRKPPASGTDTKELLRFEQRRQLLLNYLNNLLDSALMRAKLLLDDGALAWDVMDSLLQDILTLLENIGSFAQPGVKNDVSASYHVKISHLYYQQHLALRKSESKSTENTALRALRRSVESVKHRPDAEQDRAQLLIKWERFAELCRASGRRDESADSLRSIRDHLVRQEIVPMITSSLSNQPVSVSWQQSPETQLLSRTVCNLAKLDRKPQDWTWLLVGMDKLAALEHDLNFILLTDGELRKELNLSHPVIEAILNVYVPDEYPIRRLRCLLQLLMISLEGRDELSILREDIEATVGRVVSGDMGNDTGLARYLPHLRSLATCGLALADANIDTQQCQSPNELLEHVENPPQLLTNLQSLADFARIKGTEGLLIEILELSAKTSKLATERNTELQITQTAALCIQHLSLGQSNKAEEVLQRNEELIAQFDVSGDVVAHFHLAAAEYHLVVGAINKAEHHLTEARAAADAAASEPQNSKKARTCSRRISVAHAFCLNSRLALERGDSHHALQLAKVSVRMLFSDWSKMEELRNSTYDVSIEDPSQTEDNSSLDSSRMSSAEVTRANTGPEFWMMVHPLFNFITRLSTVYAHLGMYQETLYYAEQAQKVARSMCSWTYMAQSTAWLAHVWQMAGQQEKAKDLADEAKKQLLTSEPTFHTVGHICKLSSVYRDVGDSDAEAELISSAEAMLEKLRSHILPTNNTAIVDLEVGIAKLSIKQTSGPKVRVRQTRATAKATTRVTKATKAVSQTATKRSAAKKVDPPVEVQVEAKVEDKQVSSLRALILQQRSVDLIEKKEWTAALSGLRAAYGLSRMSDSVSKDRFLMGVGLIGQSLDEMGHSSVYSFIRDTTLSFPSIAGHLKDRLSPERASLCHLTTTPPRKGRASTQAFVENLSEAQEYLLEAHALASQNGDGSLVHSIATMLQTATLLLSTTDASSTTTISHPAHITCSVELARALTWRRTRKALRYDTVKEVKSGWPLFTATPDPRRSSLGFSTDMNRFQRDFVDIIPKSWNVVSVSLSDTKNDLCITKLQAGHSPFAIRLPLERASSRDADNEVFSFEQGRSELLEIIREANRTCHDARDMSQKGAKSSWWAEREVLDERMKNLLDSIEQTWLGGFRGVFAQHHRRSDLLARFQKSFQNILGKHLPSRRQVKPKRGKAAPPKVNLDPRILDLFICLGDEKTPDSELDEPLMDLLFFVVDILQFHGERNAYDEIDFDEMIVDTFDALHAYHATAKSRKIRQDDSHTILVLDKALHVFPWESLPCLQGQPVSRVPSLAYLRRAILEQKNSRPDTTEESDLSSSSPSSKKNKVPSSSSSHREGHYASIASGTYILNPSADLKSTQSTFAPALSRHLAPGWTGIQARAPSEAEFEAALTGRDLLLYFGHGSGAQYIRNRTIRRLERCRAAALLMGCSSAALAHNGDFDVSGPVWNYMLAGSPAVVGTLWDVTDRDIDRFAAAVFEDWGLLPRGTFGSSAGGGAREEEEKGKKKSAGIGGGGLLTSDGDSDGGGAASAVAVKNNSLVEAVTRSREGVCRFRYLTAAAVVVYGIPVYIETEGGGVGGAGVNE
ncbi:peptidase family C50-domain-containing protein [Xylariomycetidae sp. FL2044]|nr:peptidase family C50-domain-containing protein [Xylariomycetidae sp. FL2044]